jgi:AbrB family looped-hinge helix DNA binding protein
MKIAKMTTNGQVTIPVEYRRALGVKPGDMISFTRRENGDIAIGKASVSAVQETDEAPARPMPDPKPPDEGRVRSAAWGRPKGNHFRK